MNIRKELEVFKYFYEPRSVAIIGASRQPGTWGYQILKNLLDMGFEGKVYPVNPRATELMGLKVYPDIQSVPDEVDLAVIVVPAAIVPSVMEGCVAKGVKAATVITAGFGETGPEGKKLEEEVLKIARKGNIRIQGPNCMGTYVSWTKLNTSFASSKEVSEKVGHIAFISQSGAFAGTMLRWAKTRNMGFSVAISIGNQADLEISDYLEYLCGAEPHTRVVTLYVEGVKDGKKFTRALEICRENKKPVIAMKLGYTPAGAAAALSHTASLAGQDAVYNAVFKKYGVIRAYDFEEMFDIAMGFANLPLPEGDRICGLSGGGGWAVELSDAVYSLGLKLPPLPKEIIEEVDSKKVLPPFWNRRNPADLVATPDPEPYRFLAEKFLKTDVCDIIIQVGGGVMLTPEQEQRSIENAKHISSLVKELSKPMMVVSNLGRASAAAAIYDDAGIPVYTTPSRAARVARALVDYSRYIRKYQK
ncbi:MAG: CoA-binding protein [Candidatus Methanomethylicaceae archaeon]